MSDVIKRICHDRGREIIMLNELIEHMKNCCNCKFHCEQKSRCIESGYKEWKVKLYESD